MQALAANLCVYYYDLPGYTHIYPQDGPYRTTISEPLGKMCAYFPVVNEHISKRNKKVHLSPIISLPGVPYRTTATRLRLFSKQVAKANRQAE